MHHPAHGAAAGAVSLATPPRVLFGSGMIERVGDVARDMACNRALLICDPVTVRLQVAARVRAQLEDRGLEVEVFDEISPNPGIGTIERSTRAARQAGSDLVVGLGGGSTLDVAKATALAAPSKAAVRPLLVREADLSTPLRKILVTTTAGSGSEVSQAIVVSDEETGRKIGLHDPLVLADVAIVDPDLTMTVPPPVTADTGLDALAHALEAFVANRASPMSDALALRAARLVWWALPHAHHDAHDAEARRDMAAGAMMAGMAFTWSGLGAVHALGYPLTTDFGTSHGRGAAVMLPHVLPFNLEVSDERTAELAAALGLPAATPSETRLDLGRRLVGLLEELAVPHRLRDYGVARAELRAMAETAVGSGTRLLSTNPRPVGVAEALVLLDRAW